VPNVVRQLKNGLFQRVIMTCRSLTIKPSMKAH